MSNDIVKIKMSYVYNQWYDISCATLYLTYILTYILIYLLIPRSRVIFEKLIGFQLVRISVS